MATIDNLYSDIRRIAKNCPELTLDFYLKETVRDFCQKTWYYQKTIDLPLGVEESYYPLELDSEDQIIAVKNVTFNDTPIHPGRPEDINSTSSGNYPWCWFFEPRSTLVLRPFPSEVKATDKCLVRVVLQPVDGSENVPEVIFRQYRETIAAGALASILMVPGEVWSNSNLAMVHMNRYNQGVNKAKSDRMFGHVPSNSRIRARSFMAS